MATNTNSLKGIITGLAVADSGGTIYALKLSSPLAFVVGLIIDIVLISLVVIMTVPASDLPKQLQQLQQQLDQLAEMKGLMSELGAIAPQLQQVILDLLKSIENDPNLIAQLKDYVSKLGAMATEEKMALLKKIFGILS